MFDCDIQDQKFVKLQEKSAVNFANVLLWKWIIKLFTYFLKYKRNSKIWWNNKFGKGLSPRTSE